MRVFRPLVPAFVLGPVLCAAIDLRNAAIVVRRDAPDPEKKAAQLLSEEIAKRTQLRLPVIDVAPHRRPSITLGTARELSVAAAGLPTATPGADGYRVKASAAGVVVAGNDPRGVLFGAGYLLRKLRMERQVLEAADDLQ